VKEAAKVPVLARKGWRWQKNKSTDLSIKKSGDVKFSLFYYKISANGIIIALYFKNPIPEKILPLS
jgi:hypothetical protein